MFTTEVVNLKALQQYKFSIPTYQRPYVWGDEQITKLITDFYRSFRTPNDKNYYIGTILTDQKDNYADLIDGQQRFTTLWLTAFVFKKLGIDTQLINFLEDNSQLRLGFEIRKEVERYLNQLLGKTDKIKTIEISSAEISELPYLQNIAKSLATIENIIKPLDPNKMPDFGDFIYNNVYMVRNITPENINLNKLFSTINSAGLQLEQSDIVKSNLLSHLGTDKVLYSKIWETCENMNNFFERNARAVFGEADWRNIDLSNHIPFYNSIFKYKTDPLDDMPILFDYSSIDSILKNNDITYIKTKNKFEDESKRESEEIYCRSIINFGQLLLHTYRIHLKRELLSDFKGTFHVNRLIAIFKEMESRKDPEEIKRFFHLLWDVRFVFDKYIIKWITDLDSKTEHLELVNINRNEESYYTRSIYSKSNMLMLQSVSYFTGDYLRQFWLTPFLSFVLNNIDLEPNGDVVLSFLEKVDNQMSTCKSLNDKDASFRLIDGELQSDFNIENYLKEANGTSYKHYWFQKLEYILWKNWTNKEDQRFNNFRITSKNSIEHIHPQSKADKIAIDINDFGNLVLLSVAQNSEYSDKEVNVKKQEFVNKSTYDSLKSFYIFNNEYWDTKEINDHLKDMITRILNHYNAD
jgi:uncharacterized protein with ParB-like and HNH nuclease domain